MVGVWGAQHSSLFRIRTSCFRDLATFVVTTALVFVVVLSSGARFVGLPGPLRTCVGRLSADSAGTCFDDAACTRGTRVRHGTSRSFRCSLWRVAVRAVVCPGGCGRVGVGAASRVLSRRRLLAISAVVRSRRRVFEAGLASIVVVGGGSGSVRRCVRGKAGCVRVVGLGSGRSRVCPVGVGSWQNRWRFGAGGWCSRWGWRRSRWSAAAAAPVRQCVWEGGLCVSCAGKSRRCRRGLPRGSRFSASLHAAPSGGPLSAVGYPPRLSCPFLQQPPLASLCASLLCFSWSSSMSLSSLFCVIARLVSPLPSSLRAGERRSAHTAPRPRERRARASPQSPFREVFFITCTAWKNSCCLLFLVVF